jgi:hypothetical protein
MNRIQYTKHRKTTAYTETTKHEKKEKAFHIESYLKIILFTEYPKRNG